MSHALENIADTQRDIKKNMPTLIVAQSPQSEGIVKYDKD